MNTHSVDYLEYLGCNSHWPVAEARRWAASEIKHLQNMLKHTADLTASFAEDVCSLQSKIKQLQLQLQAMLKERETNLGTLDKSYIATQEKIKRLQRRWELVLRDVSQFDGPHSLHNFKKRILSAEAIGE